MNKLLGLYGFIAAALGSLVPIAAPAQEKVARIGLLRTNSPPDPFVDAFRDGMRAGLCRRSVRHL